MTGKTFAVFRVDREHHLMSLVSMIGKDILEKNNSPDLYLDNVTILET